MSKATKPLNYSYREHWKIHKHFAATDVEGILDKLDELTRVEYTFEQEIGRLNSEVNYWRERCLNDA